MLIPDFSGSHLGDTSIRWTHILLVNFTTDIRDNYAGSSGSESIGGETDMVYIPSKSGSQFVVIFVERVGRGTQADQKRVFLQKVTTPGRVTTFRSLAVRNARMRNRIKDHHKVSPGDLVPHELNPRTHSDSQRADSLLCWTKSALPEVCWRMKSW